jgi:hypothetical protein
MRLIEAAWFMALAGGGGACAALSGLTNYQECAGECADVVTGTSDGSSVEPIDSGNSVEDSTTPAEEVSSQGEEGSGPDAAVADAFVPLDSGSDAPVRSLEAGSHGPDASSDSGFDAWFDAGFDAGTDAGFDAGIDTGPPPMTGPTCGPEGTTARCYAGQVCCADLVAQTNACAATCAANAWLSCTTASDCPQSAPICCAQATFTSDSKNDPSPMCVATQLIASCAATCDDSPPANGCTFGGTIRLCSHGADCQSDTADPLGTGLANQCWNYNSAPESWCTNATVGDLGGGVRQQ